MLAPFAAGGPLAALVAAKVIGLVAWVLAAALLGVAVARAPGPRLRFSALALVGLSAPLAAWSIAGLETGVVTALATASVSLRCLERPRVGLALAGVAAALRPELLPYALALAVLPIEPKASLRCVAVSLPFVAAALTRLALFGRVVPLSVLAKPASEQLGVVYAAACFALTGPIVLVAPRALVKLSHDARAIAVATAVHFGAVAVAGGDWMPLSRLVVPVLPGVVLVAAHLAGVASAWSTIFRADRRRRGRPRVPGFAGGARCAPRRRRAARADRRNATGAPGRAGRADPRRPVAGSGDRRADRRPRRADRSVDRGAPGRAHEQAHPQPV